MLIVFYAFKVIIDCEIGIFFWAVFYEACILPSAIDHDLTFLCA